MRREAARTLHTLSTSYQTDVCETDYEVIAIDNGSSEPLDPVWVGEFGPNFTYHFFPTDSVSPVKAVNFGFNKARGQYIALIVDGARMVTPGLVRSSLRALQSHNRPFVCAFAWHLGPEVQNSTILDGYDQAEEDQLLDSINWRVGSYRLFEISTLAQSSGVGFLGGMPSECSWLATSRNNIDQLGGFDERFETPGGGLVNHDFLARALSLDEIFPIVILGEGSFHQIHGGVATNVPLSEHPAASFQAEYQNIHGHSYQQVFPSATHYMGEMPDSARRFIHPVGKHGC
jgi:glycosyltransferase involved in cell wall biosynthesis